VHVVLKKASDDLVKTARTAAQLYSNRVCYGQHETPIEVRGSGRFACWQKCTMWKLGKALVKIAETLI